MEPTSFAAMIAFIAICAAVLPVLLSALVLGLLMLFALARTRGEGSARDPSLHGWLLMGRTLMWRRLVGVRKGSAQATALTALAAVSTAARGPAAASGPK